MTLPPAHISVETWADPANPRKQISGIRLLSPLRVGIVVERPRPLHLVVTVPKGYVSDGASVPRLFWRLLSPPLDPVTLTPSIVHDWLYDYGSAAGLTRFECDEWYANALYSNGYPLWKAALTFYGIRLGGGAHWAG